MGLRYRGRTKGKDAWMNYSWSKKHGLRASFSMKFGPFTINTGNGKSTRSRMTTNLGDGLYHVAQKPSNARSNASSYQHQRTYTQIHDPWYPPIWLAVILAIFGYVLGVWYFGWTALYWLVPITVLSIINRVRNKR